MLSNPGGGNKLLVFASIETALARFRFPLDENRHARAIPSRAEPFRIAATCLGHDTLRPLEGAVFPPAKSLTPGPVDLTFSQMRVDGIVRVKG
jgi:hypothetical protein